MTRTKNSINRKIRKKKTLALSKGFFDRSNRCYRLSKNRVDKGLQYAYIGRKQNKRSFRTLWIQRINAYCKSNDSKYSVFMHNIKMFNKFDVCLNLKSISYILSNQLLDLSEFL